MINKRSEFVKFQFNVNLTDKDYMEFNEFHILRSPYGKKQISNFRTSITLICCVSIFVFLLVNKFTVYAFLSAISFLLVWIIMQLGMRKFMIFSIKYTLKSLKKNGKSAYSPFSVLQFCEDKFIETTETNKTEQNYIAIERISIVDNKMIYIYVNNIMAYMLPIACFESKEQYSCFFDFIKTKCNIIDIY